MTRRGGEDEEPKPAPGCCQAARKRRPRPCLRRHPWPHDGAILVETRDMEGDLGLVREGHRDSVAMHGVGAPRTGPDRVPVPLPRPCGFCPISALPALHWGHASHMPWPRTPPAHAESLTLP